MIRYVPDLSADPRAFAAVLAGYVEGIDEGVYPASRRTPNGDESVALVETDGEVVAFATFFQPDARPMYWLDLLWVMPAFRRRRLGSALVSFVTSKALAVGMERVEFGTLVTNVAMQRLAQISGGEQTALDYHIVLVKPEAPADVA